ncbi:MAG: hypothetical protein JO217_02390 [Acidobacteriaceae bacterium]|nr:hypothetical protein [Acidobacteriaceae bacterium]
MMKRFAALGIAAAFLTCGSRATAIVSRVNDQISATIRQNYETRRAALERANANFDRYIRSVDQYQDPLKGAAVELPSGYRNVWANALGEYILSDDANFNPNVGSNRSWRQLQR